MIKTFFLNIDNRLYFATVSFFAKVTFIKMMGTWAYIKIYLLCLRWPMICIPWQLYTGDLKYFEGRKKQKKSKHASAHNKIIGIRERRTRARDEITSINPIKTYDLRKRICLKSQWQKCISRFRAHNRSCTPARSYYCHFRRRKKKRGGWEIWRIWEWYAIYIRHCVTLHVIVVILLVDLFLEFLSGVIATLGQLKTRVPTVGVYCRMS